MAKHTVTVLTSDISGRQLKDGQGETVRFSLDGTDYEIDVSSKEAEKLRSSLQEFIESGRKTSGGSARNRTRSGQRGSGGSGRSKEELAAIRAWAKEQGYEVPDRGRVRQEVLSAYDAAH